MSVISEPEELGIKGMKVHPQILAKIYQIFMAEYVELAKYTSL